MIITIPTKLHEALHSFLDRKIIQKVGRQGLEASWIPIGSTIFRPKGHPAGDGGEGDSSSGPGPERHSLESWPTLVIEAGDSQSLDQLQADMRWWFWASEHDVKIVLLTKYDRRDRTIILERWEEDLQPARSGATTT
jgi:hypothetical protein